MDETVFITRYALTDGIFEREVLKFSPEGDYVVAKSPGSSNGTFLYSGKDWHRTREEADAERRRASKIASHRKSIAKLEGMVIRFSGLPEASA